MLQFCNDFKKVATVMTQPVATPNNQTVCTESTIDQLAIETGMVVVRLIELHGLHKVQGADDKLGQTLWTHSKQ